MKTAHALLALLMSAPAMAEEEPPELATAPQPFFYGAAVTKHCLTNGVRLRSHNLPGSHTVTLTTLVDTGASPYLAQVAARLWLRSVTLPEPEVEVEEPEALEEAEPLPPITRVDVYPGPPSMAQRLLSVGARTETVTTPDHTAFTTAVLLENLDGMLALERLRLTEPLSGVTEADLAAVVAELATERATPGTTMWGPLSSLLFAGTPAAGSVTLAAVQDYVKTAWAPGGTTMNLTGDFSGLGNLDVYLRSGLVDPPAPPLAEGEEAPAPAPSGFVIIDDSCGAPVDATPTNPSEPVTLEATLPAAVTTPQLVLAWSLPGSWHEDHTLVEAFPSLAERYISQGFASTAVPGTTSEEIVRCELLPGLAASVMTCQFPLDRTRDAAGIQRNAVIGLDPLWFPNNLPTLKDRMPEIRQGVRRNLLRRASGFNNGDTDELVRAAAHARYRIEAVPYIPQISEAVDLEAEPLLKMARAWLNPDRAVAVVLTPDGYRPDHATRDTSSRLTHDAWAPYPLENPEEPEQPPLAEGEEHPGVPVQPVQPLPERLDAAEVLALASTPQLDGAVRYTLGNGMSVLIVPRSGYPVVHTSLIHGGGLLQESDLGVDGLVWDLSTPFSPNKDQFVPEHPLEGQAWWDAERRTDGWVRTLSGPQPNLDGLLYILRQTTADPTIDTRSRNEYFFRLGHQEPGAWTVASRLSQQAYFGDHPLALDVPSKKMLKKLNDEPNAWASSVVHPGATTLLIIGPVDPEGAKSAIESAFGDWAGTGSPATTAAIKPVTPGVKAVVIDAPLSSAQVRLRCPISGTSAQTDLLATMLEARMWESAHGVVSPSILRIDTQQVPGDIAWMSFYAEVNPSQTGAVVDLMRGAMTDYTAELEGILIERIIREAFDVIIAADAGLRRPKMTDEAGVALLAALTEGTRPPEEIEKGMEALMAVLAEPEEGSEVPELEEGAEAPLRETLSEDALALINAAAALLAEELEEVEVEEPAEDAEPEPIEVTFVRHPVTLDDARLALAAQHGISMRTTDALRSTLVDEVLLGRGLSGLVGYGEALVAVEEQVLIDEMATCGANLGLAVLGPALTVTPQVSAAGFSQVELPKKWWK
ncbi:MAG: putative Zn-dependent peptidase [Myxococcota bacterium]|jgi:predicted Zn-dependent peptidase